MTEFHKEVTTRIKEYSISLVPATSHDLKFINDIRNDESTRKNLNNTNVISLADTQMWFEKENPCWFIVKSNKTPVGYIRTSLNTGESICIGCDIHPDHRRMGYAFSAYTVLIDHLYKSKYVVIWLEVFKDNSAAQDLYRKIGFIEINKIFKNGRESITMVHSQNS